MAQRLALGQLRVQKVRHRDGRCSYTIFDSASGLHTGADWYLSKYAGMGSDRTYAYLLVEHLRWHPPSRSAPINTRPRCVLIARDVL